MATPELLRTVVQDRPFEIRAQFRTPRKKSEEDLKEALKRASQQQEALRTTGSWISDCCRYPEKKSLGWAQAVVRRKSCKLKPSWLSSSSSIHNDVPKHGSRCLSFLSETATDNVVEGGTSYNQEIASIPSRVDSDISDVSPGFPVGEATLHKTESVTRTPTRKETRKAEKERRREEKELRKSQKAATKAAKQKAKELARNVVRTPTQASAGPVTTSQNSISDSFGSTPIETDFEKKHNWKKPLLKLTTQMKPKVQAAPKLDDFETKSQLRTYLHPNEADREGLHELPAELPPYSQVAPSPSNNSGQPAAAAGPDTTLAEDGSAGNDCSPKHAGVTLTDPQAGSSKQMLCDSCNSPIGMSDVYYQCGICNDGDRIVCIPCSKAGKLCRHSQTARTQSVKRDHPYPSHAGFQLRDSVDCASPVALAAGVQRSGSYLQDQMHSQPSMRSASKSKDAMEAENDETYAAATAEMQRFEAFQHAEALFREAGAEETKRKMEIQESLLDRQEAIRNNQQDSRHREYDMRKREQDLAMRERELALRERESALRERHASLRERDAAFRERELAHWHRVRTIAIRERNAAALEKMMQPSVQGLNERVLRPNSKSYQSQAQSVMRSDKLSADNFHYSVCSGAGHQALPIAMNQAFEGYSPGVNLEDEHFRTHAGTKRKADAGNGHFQPTMSNNKTDKIPTSYDGNIGGDGHDDEDDADEEFPKRRKQESTNTGSQHRLLACPYSKYDPSRYSERNTGEKHYRGCSSCYLTDISRLKQHLYRVHRRPEHHCARCFEVFKSKDLLDFHTRQAVICDVAECRFSEKFTEDKMKELKRKRPGKSPVESWYIIYKILFPDAPAPDSPYAEEPVAPTQADITLYSSPQTSSLLGEIFNEQLSLHQNSAQHSWLSSAEARTLINETLAQSMAELLRRITPSATPSADRTPSILVSPTSARPQSASQTPASSIPPSPVSTSNSTASERGLEPRLPLIRRTVQKEPSLEANQSQVNEGVQEAPIQEWQVKEDPGYQKQPFSRLETSDLNLCFENLGHVVENGDINGPTYCNGQATHDLHSRFGIRTSPSNPSFGRSVSGNDQCTGTNFATDGGDSYFDTELFISGGPGPSTTTLKMTNSKRSLDSGYGSLPETDDQGEELEQFRARPFAFRNDGDRQHQHHHHQHEVGVDLAYLDVGLYETLQDGGGGLEGGYGYLDRDGEMGTMPNFEPGFGFGGLGGGIHGYDYGVGGFF